MNVAVVKGMSSRKVTRGHATLNTSIDGIVLGVTINRLNNYNKLTFAVTRGCGSMSEWRVNTRDNMD